MTETEYEINIASVPDRDDVVAEIWMSGVLFAELRREGAVVLIEIYPCPTGEPWVLESNRLLSIVSEARSKLLGG